MSKVFDHTTSAISFDVSASDAALIDGIVRRATGLGLTRKRGSRAIDLQMDLSACQASGAGTRLRLAELLDADDFNFIHDVDGITSHLNRETGQLENCFLPRFAA